MPYDPEKSPQRVPAWQVSANDAANGSDDLVVEGVNVQEVIDNLKVQPDRFLRRDEFDDPDNILEDVGVEVDGVPASSSREGRTLTLEVDLNAIRGLEKGSDVSGGGVTVDPVTRVATVRFPSQQELLGEDPAFVSGLIPEYLSNGSQIRFSPGYVRVGDSVKGSANPVTVNVTTWPGSNVRGTVYFYVSATASDLEIYTSLEHPSKAAGGAGWYTGDDRCIAGLRSLQGDDRLNRFRAVDKGGGRMSIMISVEGDPGVTRSNRAETQVVRLAPPQGWYVDMNQGGHNTNSSVPMGVDTVLLCLHSEYSNGAEPVRATLGTPWSGVSAGDVWTQNSIWLHDEHDHGADFVPIAVDPVDRKFFLGGQNNAPHRLSLELIGWEFKR